MLIGNGAEEIKDISVPIATADAYLITKVIGIIRIIAPTVGREWMKLSMGEISETLRWYRKYPDRFVEDMFGIKLSWYQKIALRFLRKDYFTGRRII